MGIPVVVARNGLGMPVRPVERNAPVMQIAQNGLGQPIVISPLGAPFIVRGLVPPKPRLTVSGGVISTFTRSGIDYTQVMWRQSGTMSLSGNIPEAQWVLIGGGASGGNSTAGHTWPGGGSGSSPATNSGDLLAGAYSITIGAGGAPVMAHSNGNPGSNSTLLRETTALATSLGGGFGGLATGGDGGNGGGAGGSTATDAFPGGNGVYRGGAAYPNSVNSGRRGGGGAGARGAGGDGAPGVGGIGGIGLSLGWTNPPMTICEGGSSVSGDDPQTIGSGSVGRRQEATGTAAGRNGGFILVFPSANATVVAA